MLMEEYEIKIEWEGPLKLRTVIEEKNDGGEHPDWDGDDYGLYQIYGRHVLYGTNTLLYIGLTTEQTFSERLLEHSREWLENDQDDQDRDIYLGRVYDPRRHSKKDNWFSWRQDVKLAERILIYKYSPNYNSEGLATEPDLSPHKNVRLNHRGERNRFKPQDRVPRDFHEW
jgi:hypothetical protein